MKKQSLFCAVMCFLFLFVNQQVFSQGKESEETLSNLVKNYVKVLEEKGILGQTDDGRQADPGVIIDGLNWLFLPQGLTIYLPVIPEAKDLINVIGSQKHQEVLGGCEWVIWHDKGKNAIVFMDSGK